MAKSYGEYQTNKAEELHGTDKGKGNKKMSNVKNYLPLACYTLCKVEKRAFCECLHGIKVPSGYSSNMKSDKSQFYPCFMLI